MENKTMALQITKTSMLTGIDRTKTFDITYDQYYAWYTEGELIQNAMPNLSASDREFIMTGMTDEEWNDPSSAECSAEV
tara:strand:- start:99 stop:335 length:237 start_codon:yes stop_codon:yes gene_type:complete